jgi:hypothetical protein
MPVAPHDETLLVTDYKTVLLKVGATANPLPSQALGKRTR